MEVSKDVQKIIDLIKELSVVDLNSLVKALEEEFGVSAAAMVVAWGAAGWAGGDEWGDEGSAASNIELTEVGGQKIAVIKAVKEILGLGLKEAKELVEGVPADIKTDVSKEEAEEIKSKIEEAGGKVALK